MLPITKYKDTILEAVHNHDFTIVVGETGSGKSSQIPQYLAEYYQQIIVTEPRIMAAKTLAKRVTTEMEVVLGQEVGYRTGYDKCSSANSRIIFCTDGLQLVRTIFDENNNKESVLIIDEAHEWNLNIETLIAWCKFMKTQGKGTKVVITSATFKTKVKDVFLDNGDRVWIRLDSAEEGNITALRNYVENIRLRKIREDKKCEYASLKATTLKDVLSNSGKICKIELTMNNGGYGETPVLTYGCISLKKNVVSFEILDDEELANTNII